MDRVAGDFTGWILARLVNRRQASQVMGFLLDSAALKTKQTDVPERIRLGAHEDGTGVEYPLGSRAGFSRWLIADGSRTIPQPAQKRPSCRITP